MKDTPSVLPIKHVIVRDIAELIELLGDDFPARAAPVRPTQIGMFDNGDDERRLDGDETTGVGADGRLSTQAQRPR